MLKTPLTLKPLTVSLLIAATIPSCKTVNYVMWEWNPLQSTPTSDIATSQSTVSPSPAPQAMTYPSAYPAPNPSPTSTPSYSAPSYSAPTYSAPAPKPAVQAFAQPAQTSSNAPVGKVQLVNGRAIAPTNAPLALKKAVIAGNKLQTMPYKFGGGHAKLNDDGYDCSGTVSYVLREANLMTGSDTSKGFRGYGEPGEGKYITVWAKEGHTFIIVGGLRLDTGGSLVRTGPRWKPSSRNMKGFTPRHPPGL